MISYLKRLNYDVKVGRTDLRLSKDCWRECEVLWQIENASAVILEQSKLTSSVAASKILYLLSIIGLQLKIDSCLVDAQN
jgi:hypothetical protein